jgi:Protein of unknown function (DUF2911)
MKKLTAFILMFMALITLATAQGNKPKSPKETVTGSIDGVNVEIVYCRPSARGRKMLGGNEPYGKVWRTGANEATTIKFDKNVTIEGQALPAGTYALFTIPNENEWTFIFNKNTSQWGAYDYEKNKDKDALKVNVKAGKTSAPVETFTISLDKDQVNLQWEGTAVAFKVKG